MDLTKPQFDTQTPHYDVSGAGAKAAGTVVAEVGGRPITLGELGDAIRSLPPATRALPFETVYSSVLKQLTQVKALVIRAERRGLDKDPAVMRRAKAAADNVLANAVLVREAGGHLGFVREDIRIALLREAFPAITEAAPIGDPKQP